MYLEPKKEEIDNLINIGLNEDIGLGDITTRSIVSADQIYEAEILARNNMVLCGLDITKAVFHHLDSNAYYSGISFNDGDIVPGGSNILRIKGRGIALLEGERLALNILQRLCGIASLTREFVERADSVEILDTRKTTPGLRVFEKYAVHCGGGKNHRFGLHDAVLIKDNHIKAAGGIIQAVKKVKKNNGSGMSIEVETTTLDEVKDAIEAKSDTIMLDNMSLQKIKEAVQLIDGKARIEVSGTVSLANIADLSKTGINCVSVGALTHSSKAADVSMNFIAMSPESVRLPEHDILS